MPCANYLSGASQSQTRPPTLEQCLDEALRLRPYWPEGRLDLAPKH